MLWCLVGPHVALNDQSREAKSNKQKRQNKRVAVRTNVFCGNNNNVNKTQHSLDQRKDHEFLVLMSEKRSTHGDEKSAAQQNDGMPEASMRCVGFEQNAWEEKADKF